MQHQRATHENHSKGIKTNRQQTRDEDENADEYKKNSNNNNESVGNTTATAATTLPRCKFDSQHTHTHIYVNIETCGNIWFCSLDSESVRCRQSVSLVRFCEFPNNLQNRRSQSSNNNNEVERIAKRATIEQLQQAEEDRLP